jgi:hypothetical protein
MRPETEGLMTLFDELNLMRPDVRKLVHQNYHERRGLRTGQIATRPLPFDTCPLPGRRILCDSFEKIERQNRIGEHKGMESLVADVLAEVRATFPHQMNDAEQALFFGIQQALVDPYEFRQMMRAASEHAHAQTVASAVVDAS